MPGVGSAVTHVLADARLTHDVESVVAAARIARAHRAKLTLLHVLPRLPGDAGPAAAGPLMIRVRSARRRAAFERIAARYPHEPRMNWLVVEGDPGAEIVRAAVRHAVDPIVLDGARAAAMDGDEGRPDTSSTGRRAGWSWSVRPGRRSYPRCPR